MKVSFGGRIRDLAAKLGKEEQDIAADLGLSKSQMSHYINGRRKVPSELLQDIVNKYKINPQFLFDKNAPLYVSAETKQYNYLPTVISAGLPINVEGITESDKISIPDTVMGKWAGNKDIFITRINGDSMNRVMPDGSLIAVKPFESLKQLKNGDIVVFSYDHEYSVKRFYQYDDMIVFRPDSDDIRFSELRLPKNDIENLQIHGKVVLYIVELD